ncbi:MAG: hypothetical protein ABIQ01_03340 [Pseudolysinimonas sp.]
MTTEFDEEAVITQITDRLAERFAAQPRAHIEGMVREEVTALSGRPVSDYIAVLGERAVKKRIKSGG